MTFVAVRRRSTRRCGRKAVTEIMQAALPGLAATADSCGVKFETIARMMPLTEAGEKKLGLSIKHVAQQLKVPQYRSPGSVRNISSMPCPCSGWGGG